MVLELPITRTFTILVLVSESVLESYVTPRSSEFTVVYWDRVVLLGSRDLFLCEDFSGVGFPPFSC